MSRMKKAKSSNHFGDAVYVSRCGIDATSMATGKEIGKQHFGQNDSMVVPSLPPLLLFYSFWIAVIFIGHLSPAICSHQYRILFLSALYLVKKKRSGENFYSDSLRT